LCNRRHATGIPLRGLERGKVEDARHKTKGFTLHGFGITCDGQQILGLEHDVSFQEVTTLCRRWIAV
jgi:hypothetical protein